jgi:hypothetical protein
VLRDHEHQVANGADRFSHAEAEEHVSAGRRPTRRRARESGGLDEMAVGGVCVAIMLVFVGAPVVGLVVGGVTALGWLLWRPLPPLSTTAAACALLLRGDVRGPADAGEGWADMRTPRRLHRRRRSTKVLPEQRPGPAATWWIGHRGGGQR